MKRDPTAMLATRSAPIGPFRSASAASPGLISAVVRSARCSIDLLDWSVCMAITLLVASQQARRCERAGNIPPLLRNLERRDAWTPEPSVVPSPDLLGQQPGGDVTITPASSPTTHGKRVSGGWRARPVWHIPQAGDQKELRCFASRRTCRVLPRFAWLSAGMGARDFTAARNVYKLTQLSDSRGTTTRASGLPSRVGAQRCILRLNTVWSSSSCPRMWI
jgi:hypothetical protein